MRTCASKNALAVIFLAACLAAMPRSAPAGQDTTKIRHFLDTATDRVPATTAFPKYPSIARRDRIEGDATVCFIIRADGRISRPIVTDYSHKIFAKPSLYAIKSSRFEPLAPGQVLKTSRTCRIYRFRLDPILADNEDDNDEEG